ncbi:alpha/beta-hydrolase [Myriangium duriaei CBS 260.36]|uniref:Alpha/beta-hydrolase n=1 Tax=Myriangium duriaei CBS 260.36 TaxID=1168546 RepID=A0A9P4IXW0_9PEZI|nr:alpha/beta-hydrolase [Myriangium duriaei CBS 260.36]
MDSDLVRDAIRALPYSIAAVLAYHVLTTRQRVQISEPTPVESPLKYVSTLSKQEQDKLPYPPDAIPGGRDVTTPYGSIRAYEWGNEDGPKVLMVHGITTPCVALVGMAKVLVDKGYRVMLFDLFGRGYSGTPDPDAVPQDAGLFCTQIQYVLTSSPLSWTGSSKFHLIGYSLGGGIALSFTTYCPQLVDSLTLIAPSGLLRRSRMGRPFKLLRSNLLPVPIMRTLISGKWTDSRAPLFPGRPGITVADAVAWQVNHTTGFIPAFVSSLQHAPIEDQHDRWRILGERLRQQTLDMQDKSAASMGLRNGKVLLVVGKHDDVIVADELVPDVKELIAEEHLEISYVDAGHDLPVVQPNDIARTLVDFWKD